MKRIVVNRKYKRRYVILGKHRFEVRHLWWRQVFASYPSVVRIGDYGEER